jgi:hypothetical protein
MTSYMLDLNSDKSSIELKQSSDGVSVRLSTNEIDELMRQLAEVRALMAPVHTALPAPGRNSTYTGDNLLWNVRPLADKSVLEVGVQHPGIGWIVIYLGRDQVEDLQTSLDLALSYLQRSENSIDAPSLDPLLGLAKSMRGCAPKVGD